MTIESPGSHSTFVIRCSTSIIRNSLGLCVSAVLMGILLTGCRQDMHDQPKYKPLEASPFFADGRASRPLVPGTVARGQLREDAHLYTGKSGQVSKGPGADSGAPSVARPPGAALGNVNGRRGGAGLAQPIQGYANTFPFPITSQVMDRGQERYNAFCTPCHDRVGSGQGMVVRRGYRQPPSFHIDRLRQVPVGYFFDVITNGFGAMPDYAAQIQPRDRWAIVAYIRALQLSQQATLPDVPPQERNKLSAGGRSQ